MANDLTAFNPEIWASKIQKNLHKLLVARKICSYELRPQLKEGDQIHKPYIGSLTTTTYVKGVDVTIQDVTPTDEYLTVDTTKESSFYVDQIDKIQNKWGAAKEYQNEASYALNDDIDQAVLGQYSNAFDTVDKSDLAAGGTGEITVSTSNVIEIFSVCRRKLVANNVKEKGDFFAVVSPAIASIIEQKATDSGFSVADSAFKNGYAGPFLGFRIYVSNNVQVATSVYHNIVGKKGCIDLVVQKEPNVLRTQPSKKIGKNYIIWDLYGLKTFEKGSQKFVDLQTDA